eukprot:GHVH01004989.1.p1 GENE.GHVH01004989.1~~GHVH01004989.1.p1  ORF type:complete len:1042 (+),score=117.90 GHVH01004989.1:263-3388(+)
MRILNTIYHAMLMGSGVTAYDLQLSNIYLSSGDLEPDFDPEIRNYMVHLKYPVDQLAITPKVDQDLNYASPIVSVEWTNYRTGRSESSSMAIRKQMDLPDEGEKLRATITVASPENSKDKVIYTIDVFQAAGKLSILKQIDGIDNTDYGIIVNPVVTEDDSIYNVYVKPEAKWVKLKFFCSSGSNVYVDGQSVRNGEAYKLTREKDHHMQSIEVTCSKGSFFLGTDVNRAYIVRVMSDWREIFIPTLVLNNSGRECVFNPDARKGSGEFVCPDPRDRKNKAQITGSIEKSIRYTIETPDGQVEVRVLDGISTIPFSFRQDLWVVAKSGRFEKRWPLKFEGGHLPAIMAIFGWFLAIILALLLFCLLIIVISANLAGIGHPFGATEVFTTCTLLVQYLCFSVYMRGSPMLADLVDPLRFFTLFWPVPWKMDDPAGMHHTIRSGSSRGVSLWGSSILGDASDVRNGIGSMFWSTLLMGLVLLVHMSVIGHFFAKKGTTFPHRLRIGNWESMFMHWLCFPLCTGASMVMFHPNTSSLQKLLGAAVFVTYLGWLASVFATMYSQVKKRLVTWVWHTSSREDGILESTSGYFNDVLCDQLTTSPVNRSFYGKVFNWRWISTVADIEPVDIHPRIHKVKNNDTFAPYDYYAAPHHAGDVPIGKVPMAVNLVRARKVPSLTPGARLSSGLLSTNWIDLLMTFQAVVSVHNQVLTSTGRALTMPLTVKTHQLAGPLCNGSNAYFYDGCKIPFARIGDSLYRVILGLLMGLALASTRHSVDSIAFILMSTLSALACFYMIYTRPYSRHLENWLCVGVLSTISLTSLVFAVLSFLRKDPVMFTDALMLIVTFLALVLSVYAIIVIISVISAIMCPPLDETRFLEGLSNCLVTISSHDPNSAWAVDIPAYSKYNCRTLKATCNSNPAGRVTVNMFPSGEEPALEFDVQEIAIAARTGQLPAPAVSLTAPALDDSPLGYRHVNIYDRNEVLSTATHFLMGDSSTRGIANEVARQICDNVARNSRGRTILLVTVIPPNNTMSQGSASQQFPQKS